MAKQSLASSLPATQQALAADFKLPAVFDEGQVMQVVPRETVPYVSFAQPRRTDEWALFLRLFPGLQDGEPVMVPPEPQTPFRLQPLRFSLLAAFQVWAREDTTGLVKEVAYTAEQAEPTDGTKWRERIESALLVYLPEGKIMLASCTAKTTKCQAFVKAKTELDRCVTPEWASESEAAKLAVAACTKPFMRFVVTVTIGHKTGRSTGNPYAYTIPAISPSTMVEWKAIKDFMSSPDNAQAFEKLAKRFQERVGDLTAKIKK